MSYILFQLLIYKKILIKSNKIINKNGKIDILMQNSHKKTYKKHTFYEISDVFL